MRAKKPRVCTVSSHAPREGLKNDLVIIYSIVSKEVSIFLTFCLSRMSSDFDSSDSLIHLATADVLFPIQSIDNLF